MKYWKKSNGDCGTVDDEGTVPDSVEISKDQYDEYILYMATIKPASASAIDDRVEYSKLTTDCEKIELIARKLSLCD